FSVEDMTAHFSWERISLGGPVFDMKRLRFFNAKYLREFLRLEDLAERVKPHLEAAGIAWDDDDYLLDVLDITKNRVEMLAEFPRVVAYFFKEDFSFEEDAKKRLASGQKYLEDLELEFARLESYDEDSIDEMLHDYVQSQSVGMGKVLQPLRAALTGTLQAPGITELVSVLGRDRVLRRVGRALAAITAGLPDDRPVKNDKNDKKEDKKEDERGAA
ncbi:MAG: glutamate--tRNA ligase, partial [Deinococcota bacterium]|nr:glutamate--tRNA ligase [Deinococcota bacterium]